ncbi:tigger transposable element-derived protein 6 [Aplysia californica]|uniref:Tigger transposable element-derived protein 6 n=1 Tax=Aplysia californica TaxID=6500 RepID=A0ABM1VQQ1_APLCA|nr:tigger transposable element-derived protein 6 [Aplysia californica]
MASKSSTSRKCLSFEMKRKIIDEVEKGQRSKADICREYGLSSSTLSTFLKDKAKIREAVEQGSSKQKRQRTSEFREMEKGLLMWFKEARKQETVVWGATLKEKSKELAAKLGHEDFTMSDGRLGRFKRRHGITFKSVNSESASARNIDTSAWSETLKEVLTYKPCDVYNADETGLYFKCLPDKTLAFQVQGEACSGMKVPKDRITILCAANMDGTDKLPLLTIGKFEKPRCLKNIRTYPVTYRHNKKAWMTSVLFEEWVRKLDHRFLLAGRSVALIVDKCSAHPNLKDLRAIKLYYLPPNTKPLLQPCDQGIIRVFKALYRKRVLQRYINEFDRTGSTESHYKITLLDAMVMAAAAWDDVEQSTIQKCFGHAGFVQTNSTEESTSFSTEPTASQQIDETEVIETTASTPQDMPDLENLFERLRDITGITFNVTEYINIDASAQTTEALTLNDLATSVQQSSVTIDSNEIENDDDNDSETQFITSASAMEALEKLRLYLMQQNNTEAAMRQVSALEKTVQQTATREMRQMTIVDAFNFKKSSA